MHRCCTQWVTTGGEEGGSQAISEFGSNCEIFDTGWSIELISATCTLYQSILLHYGCPKRPKVAQNGPNWPKMCNNGDLKVPVVQNCENSMERSYKLGEVQANVLGPIWGSRVPPNMAYDDDGNYALEIRHRLLQVALIIGASAEATRRGMSEN